MRMIATFLIALFLAFIAGPTVVTYFNQDADISMAYTANEEENSSKNQIVFEFIIQDNHKKSESCHFLQEQSAFNHFYKEGYGQFILEVLSPPPRQA